MAKWYKSKVLKEEKGTVAIEMAVVSPIMFIFVLLFVEIFMVFMAQTVIENSISSTLRIAKLGAIAGGMTRDEFIKSEIRRRAFGLINPDNLFITNSISKVDVNAHYSNSPVESCLFKSGTKTGKTCPCAPGETFEDLNNNGVCDVGAPPLNTGNPGDIVVYSVIYKWKEITPIARYFTDGSGDYLIVSGGVVRNEPL